MGKKSVASPINFENGINECCQSQSILKMAKMDVATAK